MLSGAATAPALEMARKVAATRWFPLLIEGEPGVEAEDLARYVHELGPGPLGRFVSVRCRGVSVEHSHFELLGAVDDATRAGGAPEGWATLFVDEVADLGQSAQAYLGALLENQRPPRGPHAPSYPIRVVAATAFDLRGLTRDRSFRVDLLDRLSVVTIRLPALRDRREDILPLAERLVEARSHALGKPPRPLGDDARAKLMQHRWPGNCRELQAVLERAVVIESGDTIGAAAIVFSEGRAARERGTSLAHAFSGMRAQRGRPATLGEIEQAYIRWLLEETHGNRTAASRLLGVSYPTIRKKIADYRISLPARRGRR
jgi:DNA-binding NtrC family response regulator